MKKIISVMVVFGGIVHANCDIVSPEELLAKLSLREKIGQLFVVAAVSHVTQSTEKCARSMDPTSVEALIKEYGVGGVIFLCKSYPATQMVCTEAFQAVSPIPLLIMQDSEWGLSMRLDKDPTKVVRYPRNMTLGAIQDNDLLYTLGYEIGMQCAAIGVHMNLAPVVDVNNNQANPVIHDRSCGDNPERVAHVAHLLSRGMHDAGILTCIKHFPGHGDTNVDSHIDLPIIMHDRARLDAVELLPFRLLAQVPEVDAIMNAHLAVPALDPTYTPSSLSYDIVTTLLQQELCYEGLIITDALVMGALVKRYSPGELELAAFLAGNDILLCPVDLSSAIDRIEDVIKLGQVSEEELNRRVLKILRAKKWACEQGKKVRMTIDDSNAYIVRPEAYRLQERAYQAAVTVIPQHNDIVFGRDMLRTSCIVQIGNLPDNILEQRGNSQVCMMLHCSAAFDDKEYDRCLPAVHDSDTVVVVIAGMNKSIARNFGVASSSGMFVTHLHQMGKKVVVVIFGTPYSSAFFKDADAVVVAYEDAPAAQEAVFKVLCGAVEPAGILPITI